jgi:hypothetical protein
VRSTDKAGEHGDDGIEGLPVTPSITIASSLGPADRIRLSPSLVPCDFEEHHVVWTAWTKESLPEALVLVPLVPLCHPESVTQSYFLWRERFVCDTSE